ncbi:hypothetical protein LB456_09055 [Psychroflexus sp. CAK57W]|uniref:hypothetical protein n=1 Tax=Psychroflexus curvus TaxID=2873595 RepID=UPI001CCEC4E3|nr:hypothetical protein [Psychroflexus curvus]MBZ9787602.1 hypothetical protein [Psychroflexus curvus]
MAKKLYVFGIGGTGSRVIKAVTMLLASGYSLKNDFDTVVPIIIDPDTGNGDLNRTKDVLKLYQEIRNQVYQPDDFFKQEIKTVNQLSNDTGQVNSEHFQFSLNHVDQSSFSDYIGYNSLSDDYQNSRDDKNFTKLFYSKKNLESNLNVGFKGNPNMGSIVLNQFTDSEDFRKFGQTFNDGDVIFIINSIFGGTGAAGFPLLLKNLRGNPNLPNHAKIRDAEIGNITYLPYFALNKKGQINSDSFEDKAKIAIDYYNRTIINDNQLQCIYFIGNKGNTKHFKYAVGGKEQENNAHFLEMAGALALFDFCENTGNFSSSTSVKEFGIENDSELIKFGDLNNYNQEQIVEPLTKYKLFAEYLKIGLSKSLGNTRWTKSNIKLVDKNKQSPIDKSYFESKEYKNQLKLFNEYFIEWLDEMEDNKPVFSPFNKLNWGNALHLVKNRPPNGNQSFKALDTENCKLITNSKFNSIEGKTHSPIIKLFGDSTEKVLRKKQVI